MFFHPPSVGWMTSRRQCPRGVLVNVLSPPFCRVDDVTQAMSKGGACECSFTPHPPSGNPVSAPVSVVCIWLTVLLLGVFLTGRVSM